MAAAIRRLNLLMKQLVLSYRTGAITLEEVPAPVVKSGYVLVQTTASVISTGTERMLADFGKGSWISKIKQQPERAQQVLRKIRTDGLKPTMDAVRSQLDKPAPLGYSAAGIVIAVGENVSGLRVGDRVACNGAHAEVSLVAKNLVAKIPENVSDEAAAFTPIAAIALQGIRLLAPTFGEAIMVIGMGLIGRLAAQLLVANGCRVIGVEIDAARIESARQAGITVISPAAENLVAFVQSQTAGHGADGVLITAVSGSDDIVAQAAECCRKRGRIVLTGVVGLHLRRDHFYKKELSFQVSASYGPGRYERGYEAHGLDYPIGFVRWTEQRNFEAVLHAMATKQLDILPLISQKLKPEEHAAAYNNLHDSSLLASLFVYDITRAVTHSVQHVNHAPKNGGGAIALIGAGNFTSAVILPALQKAGANIHTIVSENGLSATQLARKWSITNAATDYQLVLQNPEVNLVIIATQHDQHAGITIDALRAGKQVFVEKPLALNIAELDAVAAACTASNGVVNVGFNRRFAPLAMQMKTLLSTANAPLNIIYIVNAGAIPPEHWTQDNITGGGRILGEAGHFIDFCSFLTGSLITAVCSNKMSAGTDVPEDNYSILLRYADGSNAAVHYFANGSKSYEKERVEVYQSGTTLILQNWRRLDGFGFKKPVKINASQDKGHLAQFAALTASLKIVSGPLIPFASLYNTTRATIAAVESASAGSWIGL